MTSNDYRKAQELLSNSDICYFADQMCRKAEIDPEKDYPQTSESGVMPSAARRHLYLNRAMDLLRRMIFLGATSLEVLRASEYLMVVSKSIEFSLDYRRCETGLKIQELEEKYSRNSFFSLDISPEELKDIIERDNGYYPVPIKAAE